MADDRISLPRFQEAIKREPPDIPTDTFRRYAIGRVPKTFVRLLIRRPDLADALLADVKEQATVQTGDGNSSKSGEKSA